MNTFLGEDNVVVGEFASTDESVFKTFNGETEEEHLDSEKTSSFWALVISSYLPFLFLWLRRSMFGATMLVRTLILGHLLRLLCGNVSEWLTEKSPAWMPSVLQTGASHHAKAHAESWPPPALTGLALLTIVALVVHPDGFTWVALRQIRDSILSLFQSLSSCWQLLITDYGVIPTIIASTTLASLILLMFAMLRTITPKRSRRPSPPPGKKKKKRKHNARHRGYSGKERHSSSSPSKSQQEPTSLPSELSTPVKNTSTESSNCSDDILNASEIQINKSCSNVNDRPVETEPSTDTIKASSDETLVCSDPIKVGPSIDKEPRGRKRITSISTVETTPLSDDHSCGSTSIRSYPPVSISSAKSNSVAPVEEEAEMQDLPVVKNAKSPRSKKRGSDNKQSMTPKSTPKSSAAQKAQNRSKGTDWHSRWDALKPGSVPPQERQPSESPNRNQHSHTPTQRHNNRRGGRGMGAQRKGRNYNKVSPNRRDQVSARSNKTQSNGNSTSPTKRSTARSPKQQVIQSHEQPTQNPAPESVNLAPLPPGLNRVVASSDTFVPEQASFSSSPKQTPTTPSGMIPTSTAQSSWEANQSHNQAYVSESFFQHNQNQLNVGWNQGGMFDSTSPTFGASRYNSSSPMSNLGFNNTGRVKENPFAPDSGNDRRECDQQIEADLQVLGGQMAGSILDF